jgi:hypothetical protein
MSKKVSHKNGPAPLNQFPWLGVAAGGAVLLIVTGLALWGSGSSSNPAAAPPTKGQPKLVVDRTLVDEGKVKFDTPVHVSFKLSNQGAEPLQILGEPKVELIEGC